jgi:enoyl-CoA hydratase
MSYHTITTSSKDNILTITLNRPKALNALNGQVLNELREVTGSIDPEIRGVILTGAGEKAFAAGADITAFKSLDAEAAVTFARTGQKVFFQIENLTVPVVAVVNGFALGGGCELAMACHLRIAEAHAKFGQPEVNLGLIPGYGGTQRLPGLIGKTKAVELMLTGEMIGAEEAQALGLVNYVAPSGSGIDKARELLKTISTKAPLAVARVIEAANKAGLEEGYDLEAHLFGELFGSEDVKEGINAFLEKRRPKFRGL